MILQLPCTPRAYEYLKIRYGSELLLLEGDRISGYIYNCLRIGKKHRPLQLSHEKYDWKFFPAKLNHTQIFDEKILNLSPLSVAWYNAFLEDKFDCLFYLRVSELVYLNRIPKEKAISTFMFKYDIDEDRLSQDTLNKRYYRYRASNEEFTRELLGNNVSVSDSVENSQSVTSWISPKDFQKLKQAQAELNLSRSTLIRSLIIKNISNAKFKSTKKQPGQLSLTL
jgi:hypothetical protein